MSLFNILIKPGTISPTEVGIVNDWEKEPDGKKDELNVINCLDKYDMKFKSRNTLTDVVYLEVTIKFPKGGQWMMEKCYAYLFSLGKAFFVAIFLITYLQSKVS